MSLINAGFAARQKLEALGRRRIHGLAADADTVTYAIHVLLLGGTIAPVASQAMINVLGWRGTFGVFGLVGVVWAIAFYAWFRDDPGTHPAVNDVRFQNLLLAELARATGTLLT